MDRRRRWPRPGRLQESSNCPPGPPSAQNESRAAPCRAGFFIGVIGDGSGFRNDPTRPRPTHLEIGKSAPVPVLPPRFYRGWPAQPREEKPADVSPGQGHKNSLRSPILWACDHHARRAPCDKGIASFLVSGLARVFRLLSVYGARGSTAGVGGRPWTSIQLAERRCIACLPESQTGTGFNSFDRSFSVRPCYTIQSVKQRGESI